MNFDKNEKREKINSFSNLIGLCRECHNQLEGKWQDASPEEFVEKGREYLDIEIEEDNDERSLLDY